MGVTAISRALAAGLCAAQLASCGSDPVRLWVLPPAPERGVAGSGFEGQVIGLTTITLPLYAEDQRITVLQTGLSAIQTNDDQWAVLLRDAATAILAEALAARTGATVLGEPFPPATRATMRVDVIASSFIGDRAGSVRLAGEFRIEHSRIDGIVSERFSIETPAMGEGFGTLARAHSMALAGLADLIAERLTSLDF